MGSMEGSGKRVESILTWRIGLVALLVSLLVALLGHGTPQVTQAGNLLAGFTETLVASGIDGPTTMAFAPDGRLFVLEQGGAVRVVKNGALLAAPFHSISMAGVGGIGGGGGERGLLGIAFDPNFATNNYVYLYYTTASPTIHNRVSRFTANGDVVESGSEVQILNLPTLGATNHNGGALHFGPDGKLYVAVGDNAVGANSQSLANPLGKILRINPDGTIPTDNPIYAEATGQGKAIWALGLRNPFTFAFQPGTGRIYINDVGQNTWEEINEGVAGSNYGWPTCEGTCADTRFLNPIYTYGRSQGCSIVGAAFYNPPAAQFPSSYLGKYFFADLCQWSGGGWIKTLDPATKAVATFATGITRPVDVRVAPDGSVWYLARGASETDTGVLYRVTYTGDGMPRIASQPSSQTVAVGGSATFSVSATGSAPLAYQWQRNGVDIPGATAASYTLASAQATDNGARFRCLVSNSLGSATSAEATLTVIDNARPVASITLPVGGTLYSGGETIAYAGSGSDAEDGALGSAAFTWEVVLHHDTHTHPFISPTSGATGGSFVIPRDGETSANVWYRIHLTVRDSSGLTDATYVDIMPRTSTSTLATNPPGLQVTLDGQPSTAPAQFTGVVGVNRSIGVVSPQTLNGRTYVFSGWSDGGAATHTIATPATGTTYTATFVEASSTPYGGTPASLPGTLQAEHYDNGGQGVAYNDAESANQGGAFRTAEGVDVEATTDASGGYNVGWTAAGEWLKYTVNVTSAGSYAFSARVASQAAGGTFHLEVDGVDASGPLTIPSTGGWQTWTTISKSGISLSAGQHVLRIVMDTNGTTSWVGNFNSFTFGVGTIGSPTPTRTATGIVPTRTRTATGIVPTRTRTATGIVPTRTRTRTPTPGGGHGSPYGGTAAAIPGLVQAENYNTGGQGVAYSDLDAANNGGAYRTSEGVDVQASADTGGGYNVGWTRAGEWLKYTVNVTSSGSYFFEARVASPGAGGTFHVEVDGVDVSGPLSVPSTGGWQTYQTTRYTGRAIPLSAGQHVVRLVMDANSATTGAVGNFNYFTFAP